MGFADNARNRAAEARNPAKGPPPLIVLRAAVTSASSLRFGGDSLEEMTRPLRSRQPGGWGITSFAAVTRGENRIRRATATTGRAGATPHRCRRKNSSVRRRCAATKGRDPGQGSRNRVPPSAGASETREDPVLPRRNTSVQTQILTAHLSSLQTGHPQRRTRVEERQID
jgi:hypothetical protein